MSETTVASLELRVDAKGVEAGIDALERLAKVARQVEGVIDRLSDDVRKAANGLGAIARSVDQAGKQFGELDREVVKLAKNLDRSAEGVREAAKRYEELSGAAARAGEAQQAANGKAGKSADALGRNMLGLAEQVFKFGKTVSEGGNPIDALVASGPEVVGMLNEVVMSGASVGEAFGAMGVAALEALGPVGLAVGAVVGVFAIGAQQMNKDNAGLIDSLGLTADQLEHVKNKSITTGDVAMGTFRAAGEAITTAFGPQLDWLMGAIGDVYQGIVDFVVKFVKVQIGAWIAAYKVITGVWGLLPAAISDIVVSTANAAVGFIQEMINKVIEMVNGLLEKANGLAKLVHLDLSIPLLPKVQMQGFDNANKGAARKAGQTIAQWVAEGMAEGDAAVEGMFSSIEKATKEEWRKRVLKEAGDAKRERAPAGKGGGASKRDEPDDIDKFGIETIKRTEALENQTRAAQIANDVMTKQNLTRAEANRQAEIELALAPLAAAAEAAQGERKKFLTARLDEQRQAYEALHQERLRGDLLDANDTTRRHIAELEEERKLVGLTARDREVAMARWRAEQELIAKHYDPKTATEAERKAAEDFVALKAREAEATADVRDAQAGVNKEYERSHELLKDVDSQARDLAKILEDAFDGVSKDLQRFVKGLGGVLTALTSMSVKLDEVDKKYADAKREAGDNRSAKYAAELEHLGGALGAHAKAYGDMAASAQGFFEEGSDGYKAMQIAMIAFRTVEALTTIQSMAMKTAEGQAFIAVEAAKGEQAGMTAYANTLASMPFPYSLVAGAAVLAALAAVGVTLRGGATATTPGWKKNQEQQGVGSVLGDAKAKSDSIAHSLEIVAANTNKDLEYSNAMLKALRSIDNAIGAVAASIARQLSTSATFDKSALGLGSTVKGPGLGTGLVATALLGPLGGLATLLLPGLFSTTVTRKLLDEGLTFASQRLSDIVQNGLQAQSYQTVQTETKKKFLGIAYSDTSSTRTRKTDLSAELERELTGIVTSLKGGIVEAAGVIGFEGAGAVLDAFTVNLGKVSFKDMTGEEIEKQLNAIFSKLGDDMAVAAMPFLKDLQKVGEGAFETLMRVARQYQVIDVTLSSIGKTFGAVGVSSLAARERLVDLFGSLDEFAEQTGFYAENFLSEAERLAPIQNAVAAELARLGLSGLHTRDEFKALVQGLDLSTEAGSTLFAALMALAPAFAKITEESEAMKSAKDALSQAYEKESDALNGTVEKMRDLAQGLHDYGLTLYTGPTAALSPEAQYRAAQAEFERVRGLAGQGDEEALGQLQSVSEAYLEASRDYYASSQGYFDDLAAVRDAVTAAEALATHDADVAQEQLDALKQMVGQFIDLNDHVLTVAEALAALTALMSGQNAPPAAPPAPASTAPPASPPANDNSQAVIDQLQTLNDQLAASMTQQGAIALATIDELRSQKELLERQLREIRAASA